MKLTLMGRLLLVSMAFTLLFTYPLLAEESSSAEPSLTPEEATKQAQGQINAPPTVYDLTNPGIVYSKLGEGVSAWRATLKGSANEWGVDTSPVAVQGSTRPDVVPASLQAFLLQYYKDHPQIGLAFGPTGVESAVEQLQNNYNTAVSELAHNLLNNSISEANNNSNNENNSNTNDNSNENNSNTSTNDNQNDNENPSNNSENVPPLDNNDNGNSSNNNDPPPSKKIHVIYFGSDG